MLVERILTHAMRHATKPFVSPQSLGERITHPLESRGAGQTDMLYIHVPFCRELCPFCSFHRVLFEGSIAEAYYDALQKDLDFHANLGAVYRNVYVGGGTPTILPDRLSKLVESLYRRWPIESVSVESNPDILDSDSLIRLADAGIHRLSVGVQSFDDNLLESMNRLEKYGTGRSIIDRIERAPLDRFKTCNIDLIFNLQNQSDESIASDAAIIKFLPVNQVTWYPLMSATPQSSRYADREFRQYTLINRLLADDFSPSSAWCFSRSHALIDEYIIDSPEYAAAGSGAFGYINGRLYANTFSISRYCSSLDEHGSPELALIHRYAPVERALYRLLLASFGGRLSRLEPADRLIEFARRVSLSTRLATRDFSATDEKTRNDAILNLRSRYWTLVLMREFFTGVNKLRRVCIDAANESSHSENVSTRATPVANGPDIYDHAGQKRSS